MGKPSFRKTIDISALYLRRAGEKLQVLVETDGVWRLAIEHPWPSDRAALVSHIAEVGGKFAWPIVEPSAPPPPPPQADGNYPASSHRCVPCLSCGGMRRENCKDFPNHGHEWCDCQ
jgi:hypothetical protein